jgi:hypothetical protein
MNTSIKLDSRMITVKRYPAIDGEIYNVPNNPEFVTIILTFYSDLEISQASISPNGKKL